MGIWRCPTSAGLIFCPTVSNARLPLFCLLILPLWCLDPVPTRAQIDEQDTGLWLGWFYNRNIRDTPWATQMIVQRRNWDTHGDLQQRLVLALASYKPANHPVRYGAGYYHLRHGTAGPSGQTRDEHVLFQQGLYTRQWGTRNYFTGRLRLEEHWPDGRQQFNRLRTFLSLNRPLNQDTMDAGAVYASVYNEHFLELDNVGFALNRLYAGLGWKSTDHTSWQLGIMRQKTGSYTKNQLMLNLFHHY